MTRRQDRKYARLYYDDFIREFPAIYADDAAFAAWMRLLTLAEKLWPLPPELPRTVRPSALAKLKAAGLVVVADNLTYRIRGLDAERARRSGQAKAAADARWSADGNAPSTADARPSAMPRRDEYEDETNTPQPPSRGGRRADGTNPRAVAAELTRQNEERDRARKARRQQRYLAYCAGRITEAQRIDMDERDAPLEELPPLRVLA